MASEAKQSYKPLMIEEIATAHRRLAMTVGELCKVSKNVDCFRHC